MSNDWFFEKFALIADAPGAVDRMRELVLYLAVRGQLVAREFRDIWATENLAELQPSELELSPRFDTPENWIWAPLDALLSKMKNGYSGKPNKSGGHYKVTRIETIARGTIDTDRIGFADDLPVEVVEKHLIMKGDILFSHINSEPHLGKTAICTSNDPTLIHGVNLLLMRTIPLIDPQYLNTVFKELRASGYFVSIAQRAINQSSINQKNLGKTLIPIPPLAEQKRIVAKVEELMGMCDELEAQQQERELRKSVLVRSSLSRFAESPTSENLGYLFHNSYDIPPSELRKSILTLAVQGKLVSQDPEDEPASSILKATQSFFKRLVAEKKLSEPKPLPLIDDQEEPFSLPPGWEWCRLGHIIRISSGDGLIAKDMVNGPFPVFGGNGVNGYHNQNNVTKRTLVIGRVGFYCGSIHITPAKAWVTDNAFITTFNDENLDLDFLSWLLKATDLRKRDNATAQPVISGAKIYPTVLGLPPLAEQHRIVAKVDQLMALVDELERQQAASREKASNLLDAIVHEMTSGG
jgi:type I restriction enzyme S subunit